MTDTNDAKTLWKRRLVVCLIVFVLGIVVGAVVSFNRGHAVGLTDGFLRRLGHDLNQDLVVAQRLRNGDVAGAQFVIETEVDAGISILDAVTEDENEEAASFDGPLRRAIQYRHQYATPRSHGNVIRSNEVIERIESIVRERTTGRR